MKISLKGSVLAFLAIAVMAGPTLAQERIKLRMSTPASETDQRSIALQEVFAPAVAAFADYEPHYNASLISQNSELEAISSGDLEMSIASAQELAQFFPSFRFLRPAMCIKAPPIRSRFSTTHSWTRSSRGLRVSWA